MYKWPQGRIVRIVCLLLTVMVAFDLAYNGAYGPLTAGEGTKQLVVGIVFSVLAFAALVSGLVAAGFHPRAVDFLIEVEQEMTKVEWPKTDSLWKSTIVIAIAIVVLTSIIFGIDALLLWLLDSIRSIGGHF